jgi:hypothetical protein
LNDIRWWDFTFIFLRSILSISISCIKNIYDSYKPENQIIIAPPNIEKIEELENVLRIPIANKFFWNYLEQVMYATDSDFDINNFRLLALYTDLRFYDNEIRQVIDRKSIVSHRDSNYSRANS